jgi:predicted phosphodiesterase
MFIPESITLSIYDKACSKYGITWQTKAKGNPVLEYTDEEDINYERSTKVIGACSDGMGSIKNTAVFKDVLPSKRYRYRVGDASGIYSEDAICQFPETDSDELSFIVITDTQDEANHGAWFGYGYKDIMNLHADAHLLIHTGDMVQESGDAELWKKMLHNNRDFFLSMPMAYVTGNHDYWRGYLHGFRHTAAMHFNTDYPVQDTSNGFYYSFDVGPAHFTVLSSGDSMKTDNEGVLEEQYNWAINDISSTNKKWKIVCVHNPFYSPGKYGCRPPLNQVALALRRQFNKPFADLGVDLVLCGHDHVYAQTFPMNGEGAPIVDYKYETDENGIKYAIDPQGPIHLESGCAGNQDRGIEDCLTDEERAKFEKISRMTYGTVAYSAIRIKENTLNVCYRKVSVNDGECFEENRFGIKKTSL